ncbi:MAG: high-affinity iron transporter, partial [Pseudomonadota bacterium]|nr:high-affinity iron transporter [Pseudomonadota bacterium]
MGNAFFVVWRESLEAFLIAGILYAWLQANDDNGRGKHALYAGLAAGVVLALLLGWALVGVQDELTGNALEAFQIGMLLVAAGLIAQMVLWMRKHGRQMKARLHADLSQAVKRSGFLGVAIVAALGV